MQEPQNRHEPSPEFVSRLEAQLGSEVRRRNRAAQTPSWAPWWATWSPAQIAVALAVMIVVAMGIGGAAVAAAYEVQNSQTRERLEASLTQRVDLAQTRLDLLTKEQVAARARFDVGLSTATAVMEKAAAVVQAQAQLNLLSLDLQEVRASGQEPRRELSAPRISERDFVTDRLKVELSVREKALETEQALAIDIQKRVDIGTLDTSALAESRGRVREVEAAIATLRRKLDIRQQFIVGRLSALTTDLHALEADALQLTLVLAPRIELAQQEIIRLTERVRVGVVSQVELAEAKVRRLELETELSKAELDLALIRRRIAEQGGR